MPEKSLWAWLYAAAKNALIDEKRKGKRLEPYEDYDEADWPNDPTDAILARDLLYKLPPNLMHVVSLRYIAGLNASEIGAMEGLPAATVRSRLRTAITLMKGYAAGRK